MHFLMRCFAVLFLLMSLSSCGFHLRGAAPVAPQLQHIYLKSEDPYGKLTRYLRQYFESNGIHLAESAQTSNIVLDILKEETGQQLLSVGGTLQTRQYNLTYSVSYQLVDPNGRVLVPDQTATQLRTLTIQASQILGGSNEAESMYEQMRSAIVYDIVNRLSSKEISTILMESEKPLKKKKTKP